METTRRLTMQALDEMIFQDRRHDMIADALAIRKDMKYIGHIDRKTLEDEHSDMISHWDSRVNENVALVEYHKFEVTGKVVMIYQFRLIASLDICKIINSLNKG